MSRLTKLEVYPFDKILDDVMDQQLREDLGDTPLVRFSKEA